MIINLTEQTAYLLEDGRLAFVSPIASGKEGWGTPIGSFRVISKDLNHQSGNFGLVSDSYGRIINPNATPESYVPGVSLHACSDAILHGIRKYVGMHAGYLPGYPASHGCVRMPRDLAAECFARVQIGTPVKVIGSARSVTRVRRASPIVQPGNSRYATAFSDPEDDGLVRTLPREPSCLPDAFSALQEAARLEPARRLSGQASRWRSFGRNH